jgi:hypothetical protein
MSMSDSNLELLLEANILDGIVAILTCTTEVQEGWAFPFRYNIKNAREGLTGFLLMLCVSEATFARVQAHPEIAAAVQYAFTDQTTRLSAAAHRALHGVKTQLVHGSSVRTTATTLAPAGDTARSGGSDDADVAETKQHMMLSYCWANQDVIKRIHQALVRRGHTVWIDIEQMQGSTVDAMAEAIDNAYAVVYGISEAYKVSANCRLEANYAHQQKKRMIPMMMEEGYQPNGWLGMFMGTRLWYPFFGSNLTSDQLFEAQVDALCKEAVPSVARRAHAAAAPSPAPAPVPAHTPSPPPPAPAPLPPTLPLPPPAPTHAITQPDLTLLSLSQPTIAADTGSSLPCVPQQPRAGLAIQPNSPGVGVGADADVGGSAAMMAWAKTFGTRMERIKQDGVFAVGAGGNIANDDGVTTVQNMLADCIALAAIADSMHGALALNPNPNLATCDCSATFVLVEDEFYRAPRLPI